MSILKVIKVGKWSCFSKARFAKIAKLARPSLRQTRFFGLRFAKKNYEILQSHSKTRPFTTLNRYRTAKECVKTKKGG